MVNEKFVDSPKEQAAKRGVIQVRMNVVDRSVRDNALHFRFQSRDFFRILHRWYSPSSVGIRAENFQKFGVLAEMLDGAGELSVRNVPVAIDEEKVFPGFALVRARLNAGHVDAIAAKCGK